MEKEIILKLLSDLGFPVMITMASVYIVFLTLKFILADVLLLIRKILVLIQEIDDKIKDTENDVSMLDILITSALGIKIDLTQYINKLNKNNSDRNAERNEH